MVDQVTSLEELNPKEFGPLPEAEEEVKTLARLYGPANSRVFIGA